MFRIIGFEFVQVIGRGGKGNFVGQLNNKWNSFSLKEYDKSLESFACLKPNSMKSCDGLLLCIAQGENDRHETTPLASPPEDGLLVIANVCFSIATNNCLPSLLICLVGIHIVIIPF